VAFEIMFLSVKQVPPITATDATVLIEFQVTGVQPDIVQVYAVNAASTGPSGLGDVVDTVELNLTEFQYTSLIHIQAGAFYTIYLCPRNETGGVLDDTIDCQYWETFCIATSLVTRTIGSTGQYPSPIIIGIDPEPATVKQDNSITLKWQSSINYGKFLIWWTHNGLPLQQGEVDNPGGAESGSWTARPTLPGGIYTFSVKGGVSGGVLGNFIYSDWSPTITVTAAHNLTSLRQFLLKSGIDPVGQSLRMLASPTDSLRRFMKLA